MKFAFVKSETLDQDLAQVASDLMAQGYRVGGVVQTNTPRDKSHRCDMDVQVLQGGPVIRISQSLGVNARGCQLDPQALMNAVKEVETRLSPDLDLLLINKFGRHEAEGGGFRELIAKAVTMGIPVIAGVNELNEDAFVAFSGGLACEITPQTAQVKCWLQPHIPPSESSPVASCNLDKSSM